MPNIKRRALFTVAVTSRGLFGGGEGARQSRGPGDLFPGTDTEHIW